jgi:TonB family protein
MLIEPEGYSAWSLFARVLEEEPGNADASEGLDAVAEILVERGVAALEQGRVDDAQAIVDRIFGLLPQQSEAARLATEIEEFTVRVAEQEAAEAARQALAEANSVETPEIAGPADVALDEPETIDPLIEMEASFESAIASNRLLTPLDGSAKYYVELMTTTSTDDARSLAARNTLFETFILRATQTTRNGDAQAAQTWIDEAAALDVDQSIVADAQATLRTRQIEMEALKRLPASSLEIAHYEPPAYPVRARQRNIEGWVDVEFIVTLDGETRDVQITESSHDSYFRSEAQDAVEAWRFEPRVFLGEPIEQRSFTRVRFALQ